MVYFRAKVFEDDFNDTHTASMQSFNLAIFDVLVL